MTKSHKLTTISVSEENYLVLKRLGCAGDSFNDVLTEVLKKIKSLQQQIEPVGGQTSVIQSTIAVETKPQLALEHDSSRSALMNCETA
jgi:predicted CopG family antitoxin